MAKSRVSKFSIELDIQNADQTRRSIDDIERAIKNISDSAKDSLNLENANNQAKDLAQKIKEIAANEKDSTQEIEAYSKAANKAISELEKQSTKITYSLSEQGKEQRKRLAELQTELKSLGASKEERKRAKDLEKQIKDIQKDVIQGSDEELQNALKQNRATRATLKLSQQEAKLIQAQTKQNKSLSALVKSDINALKEKIKLQFKFIEALKTTEGRYKLLKKTAEKIGTGAAKLAKAGAIGGAGLIGGALAVGGMAVASADSQVEREREANRIKSSMPIEDKQALLGDLYMQTGRDYTTIVDAINRVTTVLGSNLSRDEIVQAASTEILYPGASALFRQQNTGKVTSSDYIIHQNRMKAIQGATGANIDQIQSASDRVANMRQSSFSNASMSELLAVYAGLQNSGAYDTEEELNRAFNSFVRSQKNSNESVFEHAKTYNWERSGYGATNKQQIRSAMQNMNWKGLENAAQTTRTKIDQSDAEITAKKMRELEEKRNAMMMKLVEALTPLIESIDTKELSDFFNSMIKIVKDIAPYIGKLVSFLTTTLGQLVDVINALYEGIRDSSFGQWLGIGQNQSSASSEMVSGMPRANGGFVALPSIAGERGPEMVVPLDYSRNARGRELTQHLTQYFNMSGNETTTLSLSQAVKSRDFTRAMASNVFLNGRLGR